MSQAEVVICLYRPKPGCAAAFQELLRDHHPMLARLGLATLQEPYIGRAADGTIVEIFAWTSANAAELAHKCDEVTRFWKTMAEFSEFATLSSLPEGSQLFPHFPTLGAVRKLATESDRRPSAN